jgi:hypothetical protein
MHWTRSICLSNISAEVKASTATSFFKDSKVQPSRTIFLRTTSGLLRLNGSFVSNVWQLGFRVFIRLPTTLVRCTSRPQMKRRS